METSLAPRIVVNPAVRSGRPVVQGTRVPVELVLAKLAGGMSETEVCDEYDLTTDDVRAVLRYAAEVLATDQVRATS